MECSGLASPALSHTPPFFYVLAFSMPSNSLLLLCYAVSSQLTGNHDSQFELTALDRAMMLL